MALSWALILKPMFPRSLLTLIKALLLLFLFMGGLFRLFLLTATSGLEIFPSYGLTLFIFPLSNSDTVPLLNKLYI